MKKNTRIIIFMLVLGLVFGGLSIAATDAAAAAVWDGAVSSGFASGSGSESDPYVIKTAAQLAYFSSAVNDGATFSGKYIILADNIILNSLISVEYWSETPPKNKWTPIGSLANPFCGTFDGNGRTISGIYISTSSSYQGLFGNVSGGIVKNVSISSSYISGGNFTGGIAGRLYADKSWGGRALITGCYSSGIVTGTGYVGGIVGLSYAYLSGSTTTISCCYSTASVTGLSYNVGGIVGRNMANPASANSSAFSVIENCCSSGPVSGFEYVGGIAGQNSASIYSTASVLTSYSVSSLSGGSYTGGIVGQKYAVATGTASVQKCYYLEGTASIGAVSAGGGGNETADSVLSLSALSFRSSAELAGFDFDSVWSIGGITGYNYPMLRSVTVPKAADEWESPFTDVPENAPYRDAVKAVYKGGLMDGTGSSTFSPLMGTTRGMAVTVLWRLAGKPASSEDHGFSDVVKGTYYEEAISWAAKNGIVSGYGNRMFMPDREVSRQELAVIIYNYAKYLGLNVNEGADLAGYSDSSKVAFWAEAPLKWNVKSGIVTGTSKTELSPEALANRAQVAIIITRLIPLIGS